ncbi:hypothetical protein Tco_0359123 [Tanacetum coccineum]
MTNLLLKNQFPYIEYRSHIKTQSPRQALNKDTGLPQTSMHIPYVPDKAVHQERSDDVERAATTATTLEAVQDTINIAKTQSTATPTEPISQETGLDGGPRLQETMGVLLFKLVKKLEKIVKTSQARIRAKIVVSDDDIALEDSSKQGRMIEEIDQDAGVTLVSLHKLVVRSPTWEESVRSSNLLKQDKKELGIEASYIITKKTLNEKKSQRISRDAEVAQRLQEELDPAEKQKMAQRYFAAQKAEAKRYKPMTQAQQRTCMSNYIKHMGSHTLQQLKKLSFDEVKELFEITKKRVNTFTPMESDDKVPKVVAGRLNREMSDTKNLNQESLKRQKIGKGSEPAEESKDELSQEQLQQLMIIVPEDRMNVEALQTKYPIID